MVATLPGALTLSYSYTAFQQGQGDDSFPGTQLDADLATVVNELNGLRSFLENTWNSDGSIAAGVVTRASLASDIALGLLPPVPWTTATAYTVPQTVTIDSKLYQCLAAHTSGIFATDLANNRWTLIADFSVPGPIADSAVTTPKLADAAVNNQKLADNSITGVKIAGGSITPDKLSGVAGTLPVGAWTGWSGLRPPTGWVWAAGQALSRSVNNLLFAGSTFTANGTTHAASTTLDGLDTDFTADGIIGCPVEGFGIPVGTTVAGVTGSTITLSAPATGGATGVIRILPNGQGDGSTTFNVLDMRGRVGAGRDNMGGTAANRLTSATVDGTKLGAVGGEERHANTIGEMPAHNHPAAAAPHHHDIGLALSSAFGGTSNGPVNDASATNGHAQTSDVTVTVTTSNTGGGLPHNNVQPTRVSNFIVFAGQ
jgi:microcystin-dependent protein